jgi:hypothetical protein
LKQSTSLGEQPRQDINPGAGGDGNASASDAVMSNNVKASDIAAWLLVFSRCAADGHPLIEQNDDSASTALLDDYNASASDTASDRGIIDSEIVF